MVLEELSIPYETVMMDFGVLKQEPYISVNPNGRVPAIKDPNTGITLWETGAIIDYLLDYYDKENKLQYAEFPQKYHQKSWEHFQMSGQGPYYGQLAWFKVFHPEKNITSAIDRYANEVKRVLGVIDSHLTKADTEYLVGDKVTYVDIMFVSWNTTVPGLLSDWDWQGTYPKCYEWNQRLLNRPAIKKVLEDKKTAAGH
ncbi:hypothetical protein LTR37_000253 [Vermiconidia calcicola]|uniref:Uncharacterized protein n=1 Tax=Vermiconidia calcicola TaxID=1690605 RepID=A0ACC3P0D9_9PEZI|nr:hypothetical protein LTR37_000253 [Vermiconidia calcicola]